MLLSPHFSKQPPWILTGLIGLFLGGVFPALADLQTNSLILTHAADILRLPADHAYGIPVEIRGVVTAAQPDADWGGRFFVQDESAGIFVENIGTNQPSPGDLVEISGISHPGGFAPIITTPKWRRLGVAPLPYAKPVPIEQLMAGIEDSQRIEISGVIRSFRPKGVVVVFQVAAGGYKLEVNAPPPVGINPKSLIGARVRVRGTAATFYSGKLRHLITVTLHVPRVEDFIIEHPESIDPFSTPAIPLDSLAQYRNNRELGQRVHVKGVVIYQRPGDDLFIQDATAGMQIKTKLQEKVAPGEVIEAVGFPDFEQFLPILQDAVYRRTKDPHQTPITKSVTIPELEGGYRHADLITITGWVLDRALEQAARFGGGQSGQRTILTLQNSNYLVRVEGPRTAAGADELVAPVGSYVEVSGVCLTKIAEDGRIQSVQVLLPAGAAVRILRQPNWWTPRRLLMGLAGLFTFLIVALSWLFMISKKNAALKVSILEKEEAKVELQHANEHLEERVRERTEQLKLQITARQEAEVQFKAVLNERTRLAQELHDTLEQTLTGVALQMDTAAKFSETDSARANHHLELARNLLTQSQSEVRCSVWDLRSRSPEQIDLAGLLVKISNQVTEDTSLVVAVDAKGSVRQLPEIIEENLLRVAQEALTNIIKHAGASEAKIALDYGSRSIGLTISDNGKGFVVNEQAGPHSGHFGLLGITERTSRLNGKVSLTSAPGNGTVIQVTIPLEPPADQGLVGSQLAAQL